MPLLRTAVVVGVVGSLLAPAAAVAANYRPLPTKTCLARAHVEAAVGKPDRSLKSFGVTSTVSFNFYLSTRQPTPQGLILFTRSTAAAKHTRADIVRYLRRQAGTSRGLIPIVLNRNALVAWVALPATKKQGNLVNSCLIHSA
jgi:hypothetical protein